MARSADASAISVGVARGVPPTRVGLIVLPPPDQILELAMMPVGANFGMGLACHGLVKSTAGGVLLLILTLLLLGVAVPPAPPWFQMVDLVIMEGTLVDDHEVKKPDFDDFFSGLSDPSSRERFLLTATLVLNARTT